MWNRSENQIKLVLVRHGATPSNKEHRYLGRTDESLSTEGEQALQAARNIYPSIDYLFTSPMKRCIQTARILYPNQEILVIPEWIEMDFGDFEGKNYVELKENEYYQKWIDSNGTLPFPNGESREVFIERCKQGFYKMLLQLKSQHQMNSTMTVGLVIHGGTIMSLLSTFCGGEYFDYQVANGHGYICTLNEIQKCPQVTDVQKIGQDRL
ncbi:MAG: histidine phosphatase family protein [Lachnospiraceae bacterium]|nr:histidine phosphatase family protein [Lachnospiraceae bacterium]MBQ8190113.1 histidine phosphatase family protein [Lachnospiraceae bacterium]